MHLHPFDFFDEKVFNIRKCYFYKRNCDNFNRIKLNHLIKYTC